MIGAAHSLRAQRRFLHEVELALTAGVPILLLLATGGGYLLARQSLQPVAHMTERAARIGAENLHERLPVERPGDELGRLATVLNELLGRVSTAFEQQRQLIADASHELRTPVAILSSEAELALSRERTPAEFRKALTAVHEEAGRLQHVVEDLFLLARANAGERLLVMEELYVGELAADCIEATRALAARKQIELHFEGDHDLPFRGDEALLRRLLVNLLDNAIKYTPAGAWCTCGRDAWRRVRRGRHRHGARRAGGRRASGCSTGSIARAGRGRRARRWEARGSASPSRAGLPKRTAAGSSSRRRGRREAPSP